MVLCVLVDLEHVSLPFDDVREALEGVRGADIEEGKMHVEGLLDDSLHDDEMERVAAELGERAEPVHAVGIRLFQVQHVTPELGHLELGFVQVAVAHVQLRLVHALVSLKGPSVDLAVDGRWEIVRFQLAYIGGDHVLGQGSGQVFLQLRGVNESRSHEGCDGWL